MDLLLLKFVRYISIIISVGLVLWFSMFRIMAAQFIISIIIILFIGIVANSIYKKKLIKEKNKK